MTIQTKHFIDLSDIISLRMECKGCGATLTVPVPEKVDGRSLRTCPQCSEAWASVPGASSIELKLLNLVSALRDARSAMEGPAELIKDGGFSLMPEINPEVVPETK